MSDFCWLATKVKLRPASRFATDSDYMILFAWPSLNSLECWLWQLKHQNWVLWSQAAGPSLHLETWINMSRSSKVMKLITQRYCAPKTIFLHQESQKYLPWQNSNSATDETASGWGGLNWASFRHVKSTAFSSFASKESSVITTPASGKSWLAWSAWTKAETNFRFSANTRIRHQNQKSVYDQNQWGSFCPVCVLLTNVRQSIKIADFKPYYLTSFIYIESTMVTVRAHWEN